MQSSAGLPPIIDEPQFGRTELKSLHCKVKVVCQGWRTTTYYRQVRHAPVRAGKVAELADLHLKYLWQWDLRNSGKSATWRTWAVRGGLGTWRRLDPVQPAGCGLAKVRILRSYIYKYQEFMEN